MGSTRELPLPLSYKENWELQIRNKQKEAVLDTAVTLLAGIYVDIRGNCI